MTVEPEKEAAYGGAAGPHPTPRPWRQMRSWPLYIVADGEQDRGRGSSIFPDEDAGFAHPIVAVQFDDITVRDHPEVAAQFPHRRVHRDVAEADAALIVEAVNNYDRLRAIEAAARAWYEADRAYVEAPFGEDEEEQAVAHVLKDALRAALQAADSTEAAPPDVLEGGAADD